MPTPIKFGTDGWRGIIAGDFTFDTFAAATATWRPFSLCPPPLVRMKEAAQPGGTGQHYECETSKIMERAAG
jgi:hypothetical protein